MYMWARIAEAALARKAQDASLGDAMNAKLIAGKFFMERMMPEAGAHLARISSRRRHHDVHAGRRILRSSAMADAFIYDHVRTPRGRGKPDGSLHEVVHAAARDERADGDRAIATSSTRSSSTTSCSAASIPSAKRAATSRARPRSTAGYGDQVPGVQINRFCASGLDAVNFAAAQVMAGQHDMAVGGGVESMSRVGIGASGGAWPVDPVDRDSGLLHAAGRLGRSDRDKIRLLARRCRRLRGGEPEARRGGVGRRPLRQFGRSGARRQRPHDARRATSTCGPRTDMQSLGALKPSFVMIGEQGGFDAVAIQAHPEVERMNHVHHAGNSSGIVDGAAAVLIGNAKAGRGRGPEAARAHPRLRQHRLRARDDADRPGRRDRKVLERAGMSIADIDLFEVNEAFAAVVLRYLQAFDLDAARSTSTAARSRMGHPLGATGAMILGTALDELERSGKSTALITLCIGARHGHRHDHRARLNAKRRSHDGPHQFPLRDRRRRHRAR